jgi:biopolymer transport protein ExbD
MSESKEMMEPPESGISDGSTPYAGWGGSAQKPSFDEPSKPKRKKRRVTPETGALSINSLMDIVTIILVYLIKSFVTSPIEVKDPSIDLPISTSQDSIEEASVVMVTGPLMKYTDKQGRLQLKQNQPTMLIDGKPLLQLETVTGADGNASFRVPSAEKTPPDPNGFVVNRLRVELEAARKVQEATASISEQDFAGKVIIIADRNTPYRVLMDILITCGQAGFGEFKFAIVKDEP